MKKYFSKFLVILLFLTLFITNCKIAKAYIPGDNPCTKETVDTDCGQHDGYTAACINRFCAYIPNNNYMEKFQQQIDNCAETGSMSMECYINGTYDVNSDNTESNNGQFGMLDTISISLTRMEAGNFGAGSTGPDGTAYKPGGAIGMLANLTSNLYSNTPASGIEYLADLGKNAGFIKPAYAQGIGFNSFSPTLPLWKASRNLAYAFFIIIFLIIGFAIMLRLKISAQTVVTIQNSIPKIVIALILVTFSYAIVGLLIDFVYVIINVVIAAIGTPIIKDVAETQQKYSNINIAQVFTTLIGTDMKAFYSFPGGGILTGITGIVGGLLGTIFGGGGTIVGFIGGASLPTLIITTIVLISLFKLFFAMLKCYINIVLSVILGPIQIAFGILPGSKGGFKPWINNLIANILVFPAVSLVVLIGWLLVNGNGPTWRPPVIHTSGGAFIAFIGLGITLLLPKIPDMVLKALKAEGPSYGSAIGEALSAPVKVGKGIYQTAEGTKKIVKATKDWKDTHTTSTPVSTGVATAEEAGRGSSVPSVKDEASLGEP